MSNYYDTITLSFIDVCTLFNVTNNYSFDICTIESFISSYNQGITSNSLPESYKIKLDTANHKVAFSIDYTNQYIKQLWNLVQTKFYNCWIIDVVGDVNHFTNLSNLTSDEKSQLFGNLHQYLIGFFSIIEDTKDRNLAIISAYASKASNLMDPVKSSVANKSHNNELPQIQNTFPGFTETQFMSQASQSIIDSETDGTTIIERLNELYEKYHDVMSDWIKDFARLYNYN